MAGRRAWLPGWGPSAPSGPPPSLLLLGGAGVAAPHKAVDGGQG